MEFLKDLATGLFRLMVFAFVVGFICGYCLSEKGITRSCQDGHIYAEHVLYDCKVSDKQ